MRKRLLLPLLCVVVLASFTACNGKNSVSGDEDERITISTDTASKEDASDDESTSEDQDDKEITYEVKKEVYKKDQITIEYPVLVGNIPNVETLNELMYENCTAGMEYLTDSYTYEQTFEVMEQSDEVVSILCKAYNMYSNASHPVALYSTMNIDVKTGTVISLDEAQEAQIHEKIGNKEFEIVDLMEGVEVEEAKEAILQEFLPSSAAYPIFYIRDGVYYYLMPVNHALGDYMTITLK